MDAAHAADLPREWTAERPIGDDDVELTRWWRQFDDALLAGLVDAARADSPSLDKALARVRQARASLGTGWAAKGLDAQAAASVTRGRLSSNGSGRSGTPLETLAIGVLEAGWEVDLFGGRRREVESATAQAQASEFAWHGARVALAAEVAAAYARRRHCEALRTLVQADLDSRREVQRITRRKREGGIAAPADADLAEASVAEASGRLTTQASACAQTLNQLAALTGLAQTELTLRLLAGPSRVPRARGGRLQSVPAQAIAQRPDVAEAERRLAASASAIGVAEAARWPSLRLLGSIGINQVRSRGDKSRADTWSFGPALNLPIFDGGRAAAAVERARGEFDEAAADYRASVRAAVQEVEGALIRVDATSRRTADLERAQAAYRRFFDATRAQYREGMVGLLGLEEARGRLLGSQQALADEQLEQVLSWVLLYKAMGGGWAR